MPSVGVPNLAHPTRQVVKLLLTAGANVDRLAAHDGVAPLHLAAMPGHAACVEALCAAGAVVDLLTDSGYSPLLIACQEGHAHIVTILIEAGAAINRPHLMTGATPLSMAPAQCKRLLLLAGAGHDTEFGVAGVNPWWAEAEVP